MPMENQANPNPNKPNQSPTSPTSAPVTPIMQSFTPPKQGVPAGKVFIVIVVMAALGVGTGYGVATYAAQTGKNVVPSALNPNSPAKGKTFGVSDTTAFKDTAEGVLKEGGIEGEGQYHLERPGGESQHVYMTSSTVDLAQFINKKIKVWGQTQTAQKAGWLMDVGKVELK